MKQDVLGLQFDNVTMDEAVARAEELLEAPGASIVVTPNAEIGYEALHDAQFRALLNGADLVLPDGAGVVLAAKLRKTPLKQKVAGVDFADRLLSILEKTGGGLFLLRKYRFNAIAIIFGTGVVGTIAYSLMGAIA
mgnify:CR=1 FL=1